MLRDVRIVATGSCVPDERLTNDDLERMVDTNDEWIRTRTGIRERRRLAPDQPVSDLASQAAKRAMEEAGAAPDDIDLIIGASFTNDLAFPGVACLVQRDIVAAHAVAFDTNAVCAGYLYAVIQASQFLQTGAYKTALVIAAEGLTRYVDYTDRNSCILFGDGASAVLLQSAESPKNREDGRHSSDGRPGLIDFDLATDGSRVNVAFCPRPTAPAKWLKTLSDREEVTPWIWQDGRAMFKAAINGMTESVQRILTRQNLRASDIAALIPHQANLRIIEAVGERVGIPTERVALCLEEYGNTSAASMGIALDKWRKQGLVRTGDLLMFTAFAGGLTWGSMLFRA